MNFDWGYWGQILGVLIPMAGLVWTLNTRMEHHHRKDNKQMFLLWKENQERWISTQLEIKEILLRIDEKGKS